MPSYRRHVARHPLALARALRAVRAHAMQTGPAYPPVDPFELMCGGPAPVVGTRSTADKPELFCQACGHRHFQNVMCTFAHFAGPCGCDS
jgi:hypothetical protein